MTTRSLEKRESGLVRWLHKESTAGIIFSLPFIIGFLMFLMIPMALSLYYSLCKYDIQNPPS
ncbi:MAG: sugar ABC transporter permease, partial [Clostridia bacterium]|nr:sugar ABC transporter permease [Clostridia bacterium]